MTYDGPRGTSRRPDGTVVDHDQPWQPALPFLTIDDAATIDQARAAVDRSQGAALSARRWAEAEELGRLGTRLVDMLERNAAAVRAR